jgi:hypothetical protein
MIDEAKDNKDEAKERAGQEALDATDRIQAAQDQQQVDGVQPQTEAAINEGKKTWKEKTVGKIPEDKKEMARVSSSTATP